MPLKLTITSYQRLSPGQETTQILDRGSISIGRSAQCDWILQDPEKILSNKHCTVHHQDGGYFLTDISTNGVYLNDSEQRIGRGEMVRLQDGDRFILGEYEIAVALTPTAAELDETEQEGPITDVVWTPNIPAPASFEGGPVETAKPSFTDLLAEDHHHLGLSKPSPAGSIATEPPSDLMAPDRAFFEPPALLPETSAPPIEPIAAIPTPASAKEFPSQARIAPDLSFEPPAENSGASGLAAGAAESGFELAIPEDWWMTPPAAAAAVRSVTEPPLKPPLLAPSRPAVPQAPAALSFEEPAKPAPTVPQASPPTPSPPSERPAGPDAKILLRAFLEGAGLPHVRLSDDQLPEIMANLGAIFRETVQGMMEILLARGDVKGEFRLDRTNIGPIENNPLKTPPGQPPLSPEEVMALLLIRRKDAYMSPVQAVREGFNDIKAHQLAVMAGIQAALIRLLERFAPSNLETRLQQTVFDSILPANRKAKYWDLFTAEYRAIAHEAEEDFNELFGDEFARAYQERLNMR
ncbi:MAG TPA: type VI secretion system-associated FHA domain protein TagH [Candidatus Contendobacter sp.]|nr:type VI secretion system-associated FHA domain protein TagH [Candidatus Contendobacter sp.]HRD48072.1 type VI secretion system-associated FHA domain protein TagH [Candidatus Contendobacter sp.]